MAVSACRRLSERRRADEERRTDARSLPRKHQGADRRATRDGRRRTTPPRTEATCDRGRCGGRQSCRGVAASASAQRNRGAAVEPRDRSPSSISDMVLEPRRRSPRCAGESSTRALDAVVIAGAELRLSGFLGTLQDARAELLRRRRVDRGGRFFTAQPLRGRWRLSTRTSTRSERTGTCTSASVRPTRDSAVPMPSSGTTRAACGWRRFAAKKFEYGRIVRRYLAKHPRLARSPRPLAVPPGLRAPPGSPGGRSR